MHLVPLVAITLQARWDSGHGMRTDWPEQSWTFSCNVFIIQATNDGFSKEIAHSPRVCTTSLVFCREKVQW